MGKAWRDMCSFGRYAPLKSRRWSLRGSDSGVSDPVVKYTTTGISGGSLARIAAWANELHDFLETEALSQGHARVTSAMVTDNDIALKFLAATADENKGRTRVAAALRATNFVRKLIGAAPLSDDPRIPML